MNLNRSGLKVIAKTLGGLLVAYLAIYYANWPRSENWHVSEQQGPGEEEHEYAGRLLRQRAERLCMEKSGWNRETYKRCQSDWNNSEYLGKVDLFARPGENEYNRFVALAPGDQGYHTYRRAFVWSPNISVMMDRSTARGSAFTTQSSASSTPIDSNKRLEICGASSDAQCEEILKVYRDRGSQAAEQLRIKYWEEYRISNPPAVDEPTTSASHLDDSEDALVRRVASLCRSDEDLKKPECVTALNAYRMQAAERILAEREVYGSVPPPPLRRDPSLLQYPPPQPPPKDQVYYLPDGTRIQESPGGMRQITPPNKSALPARRIR